MGVVLLQCKEQRTATISEKWNQQTLVHRRYHLQFLRIGRHHPPSQFGAAAIMPLSLLQLRHISYSTRGLCSETGALRLVEKSSKKAFRQFFYEHWTHKAPASVEKIASSIYLLFPSSAITEKVPFSKSFSSPLRSPDFLALHFLLGCVAETVQRLYLHRVSLKSILLVRYILQIVLSLRNQCSNSRQISKKASMSST